MEGMLTKSHVVYHEEEAHDETRPERVADVRIGVQTVTKSMKTKTLSKHKVVDE